MKTRSLLLVFILVFFSAIIHSCYYDKENLLYISSNVACDTAAVSYSRKLVPLFAQQCYSCHSAGNPSGGIIMGNYNLDKALALNGKLYGSISHATGFSPMPKGTAKFSPCNISAVKKWIDSGTPNN